MPTISQSNNLGDLLQYEGEQFYSRETVTVASGQNLALGTVVGTQTADGKAYILAPAETDGTENATGVLITAVDATDTDVVGVAIVRHAIMKSTGLIWPEGITGPQQSVAEGQLKALGVLIRQGV